MPSRGGSSVKGKHGAAAKTSTVLVPLFICTEHDLPQDSHLFFSCFILQIGFMIFESLDRWHLCYFPERT